MYPLPCINQMASEKLLCRDSVPVLCGDLKGGVGSGVEGRLRREGIYVNT